MCTKYDEEVKLWINSEPYPLDDVSDWQWIWKSLVTHGPKVAQINADTGVKMTYNEIRLRSIQAAQNLLKRGFEPRQKLCFMSINSDHLVPLILASIGLLCPIVPLCPILSKGEIVRILTITKPSITFCDTELHEMLRKALNELEFDIKIFILDGQVDGVESVASLFEETGEEDSFIPMQCDPENDSIGIFCSSGTTGPSKCASIPYSYTSLMPLKLDENTVLFSCDIIYWTIGCRPIFHAIYNGVVRVITSRPFTPELQLEIIEKYNVTDLYNTPFVLTACIKSDAIQKANLSSVKRIVSYGGVMPQTLITDIKRSFPNGELLNLYGLTEIGAISMEIVNGGNVGGGKLVSNCTIEIIDDNGNRCGPNENGEIFIKTKYQFLGYFDDRDATAAAIDENGFFRTGDVGHFDDNGNLFIEDRKKNVMKVFYFDSVLLPSKIEDLLIKDPSIKDVCVVGIPIVCDDCLPAALVVRDPNSNLKQCDVFNVVAENFSDGLKLRGGVYFVDSLPRTHNGKLVRNKATKMAEEMFEMAKENDHDVREYLLDISVGYRKLIPHLLLCDIQKIKLYHSLDF